MENGNVLICGVDGYIGHALALRLLKKGFRVVGVDDYQRRANVESMGSFSAIEIEDRDDRILKMKDIGEYSHFTHSIHKDYERMCNFLSQRAPFDAIVNLAQQPSAPFSHRSREDAEETTINNVIGTLNVLHFMKEYSPDSHLIQIGSMGEYDPAMGTEIPEGLFDLNFKGRVARNVIFPRRPGSWYHASKVSSTYYIDCACRWWGVRATDIMQGVVYGNWTPEIEDLQSPTRLDSDESFGTVVNRFIVQAALGEPLTIYGKGLQSRGYLALTDSVQCLMLAIVHPPEKGEYRTWNQLDEVWNIVSIAYAVEKVAKKFGLDIKTRYIPSPRAERTDAFDYKPHVDKLIRIGFKQTREMEDEIKYSLSKILPHAHSELYPLRDVVEPKIKWEE